MARKLEKLTLAEVAKIASRAEFGMHADGAGLYLQIKEPKAGSINRSWVFRYKRRGARGERVMGLGPLHTIGLKEARELARKARQQLLEGTDPIEARRVERDSRRREELENFTFKSAAQQFLNLHEGGWRNEKHRAQWHSTLEKYAYPTLGNRPVKAIDAALINGAIADPWRKTPETASRVKQRIEKIIQWVRDGRPLPVPSATKRVRHHAALALDEMPAFMTELRQRTSVSAQALEFLILTAARTSEVIGATWDEIDISTRTWTIPNTRMKGGKEHRVPLSARAIEILNSVPIEEGNPYVFIGGSKGAGLSNMALLQLLRGLRPGQTVHGFRSTFKDWASERTSHPNIVSEMALAHSINNKVEKAYRRGDLFAKRSKLMDDWARFCSTAPARVVPFEQAKTA